MQFSFKTMNPDLKGALEKLAKGENEVIPLKPEDVMEIHSQMLIQFGGTDGIRDQGLFESVCATPYQSVFGQDLYPTAIDKAAKYLFDFSNYQVFVDGNKRTGLMTAFAMLAANNMMLTLSEEQMVFLTLDIANHKIETSEQVADVLKENVKFMDRNETAKEYEQLSEEVSKEISEQTMQNEPVL